MTSNKKKFVVPQLTVHGNVEKITEQGSQIGNFDVPFGTTITVGTTPNDITS